jgi:hypothetical protein
MRKILGSSPRMTMRVRMTTRVRREKAELQNDKNLRRRKFGKNQSRKLMKL